MRARITNEQRQSTVPPTAATGTMTTRQKAPSVTYTYLIPAAPSPHQWRGEVALPPPARRNDTDCLTCFTCNKEFGSTHDFVVHQRRHTGERPFQCSRCFESFASASALLLHRGSVHDSRSPFRCTFCGRSFDDGDAYSRHLGRHRRAGYCFRCSCTRLFRDEIEIKAHLDMHGSGKGHKCPCCRKVYESLLMLGAHFRKHEKSGTPPKPHRHR